MDKQLLMRKINILKNRYFELPSSVSFWIIIPFNVQFYSCDAKSCLIKIKKHIFVKIQTYICLPVDNIIYLNKLVSNKVLNLKVYRCNILPSKSCLNVLTVLCNCNYVKILL